MQNFQDTFETRKQLFISALSICMTVPLNKKLLVFLSVYDLLLSTYIKGLK